MAKRTHYNPNHITLTERLAFNLSGDKKKVRAIRQPNKGCLPWQRHLVVTTFSPKKKKITQIPDKPTRRTVVQYRGDNREFVQTEE